MASNVIYIHDLPFKPRNQLCRILDADRRWEELGGNHMGYDVTTLTLISHAIHRDRSPTWELLNRYSERNGTIKNLFIMLAKMDHQRAMSVLKPYGSCASDIYMIQHHNIIPTSVLSLVDEKYHQLLRNESMLSTSFFSYSKKDIPRPSMSQMSITTKSSLQTSHSSSTYKHNSSTHYGSHRDKENFTLSNSKVENNLANLNQNFSSLSMKSKNVTHVEPKAAARKRPSDLVNIKKNAYSKEESVTDNCVSEKIRNGKKPLVHEMLNGKHAKQNPHLPSGANYNSHEDSLPDIMHIPYSDICKATDGFNDARVLGRGGFGTVYKGEWKGTSVAIKRLTPRKSTDNPAQQLVSLKQSLNELNILKCCRFDHILPLYAVSLDGNPCLIYQLMVNGSLEDRLLCKHKTPPLTWSQRSHIAECTAKGLNYLHTTYEKPLVHGDIKSANILLDNNMDAKIGDFGLTREGPGCDDTHVKVTSISGTECYLPPEYLRHRHLSPQVDIYSYGIVLLEVATGLRPFDAKRGAKRLVDHVKICDETGLLSSLRDTKAGEESMIWFRELIQIGQVCSNTEKKKRPTMQQVLGQFNKVKDETAIVDKIRRLSNDQGKPPMKLSPDMHLTPMELQMIYDFQKNGCSGASDNKKLLNIAPENSVPPAIPVVIDQMKDMPVNSKESESSFESLERRGSYVSSDSSSITSENDISASPKLMKRGPSEATNGNCAADSSAPPVPLLTLLQMQVSASGDKIDEQAVEISTCTEDSNIT